MKNRVVFLDRDGTINIEKNYLYRIEDFEFIPGAEKAISMLNRSGYQVVVVSNQAGVARGYYTVKDVEKLHNFINMRLKDYGAHIDQFFFCPHHPEAGLGEYKIDCNCRKPKIGMFLQAEKIYQVDKNHSWMIGDNTSDIKAGQRYGIRTILVKSGYGKEVIKKREICPDYIKKDLYEAVCFILNMEGDNDKVKY